MSTNQNPRILTITWGTSKARDTYGYNICTLKENGKKLTSCNGGGYSMIGTVLGEFMEKEYQDRLLELARRGRMETLRWNPTKEQYDRTFAGQIVDGATYYAEPRKGSPKVAVEGASGERAMEILAEAIGLHLSRRDNTVVVTDNAPALVGA